MCLLLHSNKVARDISLSETARPTSARKRDGRKTQSILRCHSCPHAAGTSYCNWESIPKHTAQELKGHLFPAWTSFETQGIVQYFLIDQEGKKPQNQCQLHQYQGTQVADDTKKGRKKTHSVSLPVRNQLPQCLTGKHEGLSQWDASCSLRNCMAKYDITYHNQKLRWKLCWSQGPVTHQGTGGFMCTPSWRIQK